MNSSTPRPRGSLCTTHPRSIRGDVDAKFLENTARCYVKHSAEVRASPAPGVWRGATLSESTGDAEGAGSGGKNFRTFGRKRRAQKGSEKTRSTKIDFCPEIGVEKR